MAWLASFNVLGLEEAELALLVHADRAIMKVDAALEAGAKVLIAAQRSSARSRLGTRTNNTLAKSIGKSRIGKKRDGRNIQVYPQGKQPHGTPGAGKAGNVTNAQAGFVNEYGALGSRHLPPSEWMSAANAAAEDEVNAAMLKEWEGLGDG